METSVTRCETPDRRPDGVEKLLGALERLWQPPAVRRADSLKSVYEDAEQGDDSWQETGRAQTPPPGAPVLPAFSPMKPLGLEIAFLGRPPSADGDGPEQWTDARADLGPTDADTRVLDLRADTDPVADLADPMDSAADSAVGARAVPATPQGSSCTADATVTAAGLSAASTARTQRPGLVFSLHPAKRLRRPDPLVATSLGLLSGAADPAYASDPRPDPPPRTAPGPDPRWRPLPALPTTPESAPARTPPPMVRLPPRPRAPSASAAGLARLRERPVKSARRIERESEDSYAQVLGELELIAADVVAARVQRAVLAAQPAADDDDELDVAECDIDAIEDLISSHHVLPIGRLHAAAQLAHDRPPRTACMRSSTTSTASSDSTSTTAGSLTSWEFGPTLTSVTQVSTPDEMPGPYFDKSRPQSAETFDPVTAAPAALAPAPPPTSLSAPCTPSTPKFAMKELRAGANGPDWPAYVVSRLDGKALDLDPPGRRASDTTTPLAPTRSILTIYRHGHRGSPERGWRRSWFFK
ncbi:uncharacterized protein V1510DRAFT_408839 [Dipodascopsis tothii]|uniref:uncharacterized protein n=1 Tax=Dipodascopsis tothii TaxID=44089 RepID=UPI0034CDAF1E